MRAPNSAYGVDCGTFVGSRATRLPSKIAAKETEFSRRADELRQQQDELAKARANVEEQIKQRLETERRQVVAAEAKRARDAVASDLQARANEVAELQRTLESNNIKLAEAQQAQAELMRKQRALDDEKRELDLTIEKRVQASVETVQAKARQEAHEAAGAKSPRRIKPLSEWHALSKS